MVDNEAEEINPTWPPLSKGRDKFALANQYILARISRIYTDSIANQHPSSERRGWGRLIIRLKAKI